MRSLSNPKKISALLNMQQTYPDLLELVEGCDLTVMGSFQQAVAGCVCVFHTASPFWVDARVTNAHEQLVTPAVNGTVHPSRVTLL